MAQERILLGPAGHDLPMAIEETRVLATKWGLEQDGQPYVFEKMRIERLYAKGGRLAMAHISSHSAFDAEDYLRSAIQFYGERLTVLSLIGDEKLSFKGMKLFYLSSCESGVSRTDAGDELQGLVWSIMYAGAQAVMGSLWPVDDSAAYYMARRFYAHVDQGLSLMEAHRQAIIDLRREPELRNPYFWAPFALFGDGFQSIRR